MGREAWHSLGDEVRGKLPAATAECHSSEVVEADVVEVDVEDRLYDVTGHLQYDAGMMFHSCDE